MKKPENKKESVTETLKNIGAPEIKDFEAMRKMVAEFKKMQKEIRALPKDVRAKLMPKRVREISENIKPFIKKIETVISQFSENIVTEFKGTVTKEKPDGQKWLTFKLDKYTFCVAINKSKAKKPETEGSKKPETEGSENEETETPETEE